MFLENAMNQQRPWVVDEEERCNPVGVNICLNNL